MLVLKRSPGGPGGRDETVLTLPDGRQVTVKLVDIQGQTVRLGIEAPPDVAIYRGEVQRQIEAARAGVRAALRAAEGRP